MGGVGDPVRARVTFAAHGQCRVVASEWGNTGSEGEERWAPVAGKVSEPVVAGDWVLVRNDVIEAVLPRATWLARKEAGRRSRAQVLAANVDVVAIVTSLDVAPNARRVERFVAMAIDGGARPVVVLTKADVCSEEDVARAREALGAGGAPAAIETIVTSARDGRGIDVLRALVAGGATIALVGPSGVGKSALTNRLLDRDAQREGEVRDGDGKGRHTTAHRALFAVRGGGWVLDMPGLRELALWTDAEGDGERATPGGFDDIDALAVACRFRDCTHVSEPGCAVRAAIDEGSLDEARLASQAKLAAEARALAARREPWRDKQRMKVMGRALRAHPKYRR